MNPSQETVLSAADASANATSAAVDTRSVFAVSAQVITTGAPVGSLKLQASNDSPLTGSPTNWTDIAGATVAVSAASTYLIPKLEICYQYIRAAYVFTSGTGTVTVNLKSLGM